MPYSLCAFVDNMMGYGEAYDCADSRRWHWPEVTGATRRVVEAAGLQVEWVELPAGANRAGAGLRQCDAQRTLAAIKAHKVLRSRGRSPRRWGKVLNPLTSS